MPVLSWSVVALALVVAAGLWLVAIALLMGLFPHFCRALLEKMSANLDRSNWRLQLTEQGLRLLAGLALVARAPDSKLPPVFEVAGWLLLATSLLILLAPIRWHAGYGRWLLGWITPRMLRILAPVPAAAGVGLIYAAL